MPEFKASPFAMYNKCLFRNKNTTELLLLLQPLYESGLLTSPTTSDIEIISDADVAAIAQSIDFVNQPISETIIEDRGEW
ncbi:MAG: hypothetical protein KME64_18160 [Scytonematopsis contorta HA4267-MV1]|nr:hypothetical protein [Scytonematopsis contorta HA4267-MV1]